MCHIDALEVALVRFGRQIGESLCQPPRYNEFRRLMTLSIESSTVVQVKSLISNDSRFIARKYQLQHIGQPSNFED